MQTQPRNHRHFGWKEGIKLVTFIKTTLQDLKRLNYRVARSAAKVDNTLAETVGTITKQEGATETYSNLSIIGAAGMHLQITSTAPSACPPIFGVEVTGSLVIAATIPNSKVSPDYLRWDVIASPGNLMSAPSGMLTSIGYGSIVQVEDGIQNTVTYTAPAASGIQYLRVTSQEDPTATIVMTVYVGMPIPTQADYTALIQASRMILDFARRK